MKRYTISWTEHTDCQAEVVAETEELAIEYAMAGYMGGTMTAETKGKTFADSFEIVSEED